MGRIRIRTLDRLVHADVVRLVRGYRSEARYAVHVSESRTRVSFALKRTAVPYAKTFPHPPQETARYREIVALGWSLGAYDGRDLVGLAVAEPRPWNRSVFVWELGVAPTHRRCGIATAWWTSWRGAGGRTGTGRSCARRRPRTCPRSTSTGPPASASRGSTSPSTRTRTSSAARSRSS